VGFVGAGPISPGRTIKEAVTNLKEVIELRLAEFPFEEQKRPKITTFEVAGGGRG